MDILGTINSATQESRNETENSGPGRYVVLTAILFLLASVSLNVFLAHRVWSFTHFQSIKASERIIKAGTTVLPIAANRLGGQQEVISFASASQPTVLYVFTPPCTWCTRNIDNLKALLTKETGEYRFIGISLSEQGLAEYVSKNDLKLPVYSGLSPEMQKAYKLGSTPQTIVISPEGLVLQDWVGAYVGDQKSQIEAFFHVSLPGLRELPKTEASGNRASAESN